MRSLPFNCELDNQPQWTLDEKFALCRDAGFESIECWLSDEDEREVKDALDRHKLKLILGHRPFSPDDVRKTVERAVCLDADFIFAQPADAYTSLDDVKKLVVEGRKIANDAGIPCFFETHRNNYSR